MPVLLESAPQLGLHFGAEGAQVVVREGAHDVEREGERLVIAVQICESLLRRDALRSDAASISDVSCGRDLSARSVASEVQAVWASASTMRLSSIVNL